MHLCFQLLKPVVVIEGKTTNYVIEYDGTETVPPSGDHSCIDITVPSSDHCCTETVPPSSDHRECRNGKAHISDRIEKRVASRI